MDNLLLIFLCLAIGLVLQKVKSFPANSYHVLNQFVICISLPAIAFYFIPEIKVDQSLLFPLAVAWITFVGSFIFFNILGKCFGWSRKLIGCLILTAGLGNTAFVGFPVIEALYGKEGIKTAIIIDQPGTFVILSTLGIATAAIYSKGKPNFSDILKKVFLFPPFVAFLLASIINLMDLHFIDTFQSVFQKLGSTVTPLALISVGLQLRVERKSKHWQFLFLGLGYKLMLLPALIYLLYVKVFEAKGIPIQISIIEAAMAPMITAAIVSASYGLKPRLSSMMIGFGIPISFITLAFWYSIVRYI